MGMVEDAAKWLGKVLTSELKKPLTDINDRLDKLEENVSSLVDWKKSEEVEGLEADLSLLDDRICQLIHYCAQRGYTTAEERRRCSRMHEAYKARGGNHGEDQEYDRFVRLPTEEEWRRSTCPT